jgi:hypothetical protein
MAFHSRSGRIGITALLIVGFEFGHVETASAQVEGESGLVGLWYGEIVPYDGAPFRLLGMKKDGTCYWAIYTDPKKRVPWEKTACKLDHRVGKAGLVTSAKSQVGLTLVDENRLKGSFSSEYHGGYFPRSLEMRRENPEKYGIR